MLSLISWIVFSLLLLCTVSLAVYGLHLYVLLWLFLRRVRERRRRQQEIVDGYGANRGPDDWPIVSSQIPLYNEIDVAERVISAVAAMDYPQGRHEIQVLDDSDDGTRQIIDEVAARLSARGFDVKVLRRGDRTGFKAGALAAGTLASRGEYLAVFDSDFVPPAGFLRKAVALLEADRGLACLQGRWDHLNRNESWLTQAQSLGIDAHFAIEQGARAWNGLMMNFNGTAGVWRKAAILDPAVAGEGPGRTGWSGDTLTEDLDLSYQVQLAGWRLDYCLDLPCPAELPGTLAALKSQQRRWATGSIQVARKQLPSIFRSKASLGVKVEAALHLTHYSVSLWMLVLALIARPMLIFQTEGPWLGAWFVPAWCVVALAAIAPSLAYMYARYSLGGGWSGLRTLPGMLILGCGLCVSNSLAVLRGLSLRGGEFIRTPKSGSRERRQSSSYQAVQGRLWIVELSLGAYSLVSFLLYVQAGYYAFSLFMLLYAAGFLVIGWLSRPRRSTGGFLSPSPTTVAQQAAGF